MSMEATWISYFSHNIYMITRRQDIIVIQIVATIRTTTIIIGYSGHVCGYSAQDC